MEQITLKQMTMMVPESLCLILLLIHPFVTTLSSGLSPAVCLAVGNTAPLKAQIN